MHQDGIHKYGTQIFHDDVTQEISADDQGKSGE